MKTVDYKLGDQVWHLCLNGSALVTLYEKFGTEQALLEHIQGTDRQAFEATCTFLAVLGTQGELVRRWQGLDHGKIPSEQLFRTLLAPLDVAQARAAIGEAVRLGFTLEFPPEEENPEEVDLGLQEIRKKGGAGFPGAGIFKKLRRC